MATKTATRTTIKSSSKPKRLSKIGEYWAKTGKNIIEGVTIIDMRAVLK
ncbi:MAG: hypothetical protein ACI30H_03655 [Paludibacteraceae bacterium]